MKKEDFESFLSILFIICFGLGAGYYANKYYGRVIDFEKKSYIPFEYNNELYLINSKNGKTYLLEKIEGINGEYWYNYKFLTKTKTNKIKKYKKNDPLDLKLDKKYKAPKGGRAWIF